MKRLALAALVCAGFAPMSASPQSHGLIQPGERTPTTIPGATITRSGVSAMTGLPMTDKRRSTDATMDEAPAIPDRLAMVGFAEGEVRKVDEAAGKLTLRHTGMEKPDMPPMTMVFRVRNLAWLHDLKVGDKVYFRANRVDGNLTVTTLERESRGSP